MQRKHAFLLAGFLTAAITTAVLSMTGFAFDDPSASLQVAAADAGGTGVELQDAGNAREAALQLQLAQSKQALLELDARAQPQVAGLQAQLAEMEGYAVSRTLALEALEAQTAQAQSLANQDAAAFQQELATLQATESQLRQQLDGTIAQLQAAYGEVAARQAVAGVAGNAGEQEEREEYEEHDDHDEHEDEENEDGDDD
jgi:hypothetical protein